MLGLAIKGGVWIGFAGLFLGMGLGRVRYPARELLLVILAMLGLFLLGIWLLNEPFDPEHRRLPLVYFSDDWRWEPDAELHPRREVWGGLWCALLGAIGYAGWRRKDRLAWRLACWGIVGGAIGFPVGQSVQAFHAWNLELFSGAGAARWASQINWWNWMETTFGLILGAVLGLGLWIHRREIRPREPETASQLGLRAEVLLATFHAGLLVAGTFLNRPLAELYQEFGLVLVALPIAASAAGRLWPWLVLFPLTLLPIAGKTLQRLVVETTALPGMPGWVFLLILPLAVACLMAGWSCRRTALGCPAVVVLSPALVLSVWTYFSLNFAFCGFPWPWTAWTARTPNSLMFAVCALGLTLGAVWQRRQAGLSVRPE
jgi:hypothetical protein